MPLRRSSRKPVQPAVQTHARRKVGPATGSVRAQAKRPAHSSDEVRDYIADMAGSLAQMALASQLDSLAVACEVVREIAQGNAAAEARLLRLS